MGESIECEVYCSFKKPMHIAVLKRDLAEISKLRVGINDIENGMTPLHLAVLKKDQLILKLLVSCGASLRKLSEDGYTPLQLAVMLNRITLFDALDKPNDIDTFDKNGNSALHLAVIRGNADAVTALLKLGADADMPNKEGHAPLHIAIILGKPDVIDAVLSYTDKPNMLDVSECRPLHLAVMNYQPGVIRKIGELFNAKVNYLNGTGDSPLHLAAKWGNREAIQELHDLGASMNLKNSKGFGAIHVAVICDKPFSITTLVRCGANIDFADKDGNTPIHCAVIQNNIRALNLLCRLNANLDLKNSLGDSPLHTAILLDNRKALKVLLECEANFDILNAKGMTPLHLAACFGSKSAMQKLIRVGARIQGVDANGDKPLHSAAKFCNSVGIKTMFRYLANLDSKNGDGLTAVDIVFSYVKKNNFKTAVESVTDLHKKFNLNRNPPLGLREILKCAKVIVRYEVLKHLENSKLNDPEYVADIINHMRSYIKDSIAEVKLMKSTLLHENFFFYSFVMTGWIARMPLTRAYTSEVVLEHVLDVARTKGYPVYRNLIISRLERPALLKKVSQIRMFTSFNGKTTFLDLDVVPLIVKDFGNNDILNLLLAYSVRDQNDSVANSTRSVKRKFAKFLQSNLHGQRSAKNPRSVIIPPFERASRSKSTKSKKSLRSATTNGTKEQKTKVSKVIEKAHKIYKIREAKSSEDRKRELRSVLVNSSERACSSKNTKSKKALRSATTIGTKEQVLKTKVSKFIERAHKINKIRETKSSEARTRELRSSLVNSSERASSSKNTKSKKALKAATTIGKKKQVHKTKHSKNLVKTTKNNSTSIIKSSEAKKRVSPRIKNTRGNGPLSTEVNKKSYRSATAKSTKEKYCALSTRSKTRSLNSKRTKQSPSSPNMKKKINK